MKLFEMLLTNKQNINGTLIVEIRRSISLYDNLGWYWYENSMLGVPHNNSFITLIVCDVNNYIFDTYLNTDDEGSKVEIPHFYGLVQRISNMFDEEGKW